MGYQSIILDRSDAAGAIIFTLSRPASVDLAGAPELEAFAQARAITSEDHAEGVRAFLERRTPKFSGS